MQTLFESLWNLIPVPEEKHGDRLFDVTIRISPRTEKLPVTIIVGELGERVTSSGWLGRGRSLTEALERMVPTTPITDDYPELVTLPRLPNLIHDVDPKDIAAFNAAVVHVDDAMPPGYRWRDGATLFFHVTKTKRYAYPWSLYFAVANGQKQLMISHCVPEDRGTLRWDYAFSFVERSGAKHVAHEAEPYRVAGNALHQMYQRTGDRLVAGMVVPTFFSTTDNLRLLIAPTERDDREFGLWSIRGGYVYDHHTSDLHRMTTFSWGFGSSIAMAVANYAELSGHPMDDANDVQALVQRVWDLVAKVPIVQGCPTTFEPYPHYGVDVQTFSHVTLAIDRQPTTYQWRATLASKHEGHPIFIEEVGSNIHTAVTKVILSLEAKVLHG